MSKYYQNSRDTKIFEIIVQPTHKPLNKQVMQSTRKKCGNDTLGIIFPHLFI